MESINKPFKIYSENTEQETLDQFKNCMQQDWVLRGALMADSHLGYTLPIGGVVETLNVVSPVFVGFDVGCGVIAQLTSFKKEDVVANKFAILDTINKTIPLGYNHHQYPQTWREFVNIPKTSWFEKLFYERNGFKQLGTLGGNNHFLEIGFDENDMIWICIHSGSRGIGHDMASYYIAAANPEGKAKEGAYALDVNSVIGKDYIMDMNLCLAFALENRKQMVNATVQIVNKFTPGQLLDWQINRTHNHAESKDGVHWIHRKGATHAEKNMYGVIPGNMRDGSFIVKGKGNPESLYSSSHGAGRVFSRKEAQRRITKEDMRNTIGETAVVITDKRVEEAPGAYKNIFEVMALQKDLVEVIHHIKPIICVKG